MRRPDPLRIVVTGLIGQYPLGGVTWDYLQYVLGFARLGHDVYYLEDTGQWPYDPVRGETARGPERAVQYLRGLMRRFDLDDRWAYRFAGRDRWFGLSAARRREVLRGADVVLNVSGSLAWPGAYRDAARLVYLDSDPVFTQIKWLHGSARSRTHLDLHDAFFTFGERLGARVPVTGHAWRPTRQPVVLSEWAPVTPERPVYTTVMNWTSYADVRHEGRVYGQKDMEFRRFLDLPGRVAPLRLECAMNVGKTRSAPMARLQRHGWALVDPEVVCADVDAYRRYVGSSRGEWSVAKNGYVQGRPGWFSCRSACYLAAGRPVVVQDTGFDGVLPTGEGLVTFTTPEEAVEALRAVDSDHGRHARRAREIAEAYFDSDRVLTRLLDDALAAVPTGRGSVA